MSSEKEEIVSAAQLTVLNPGIYSLLVDFGRSHSRGLGVPVGGAADRTSMSIGNALVGNVADAVALEVSFSGPTLRADGDLACVVYGAPFEVSTKRQTLSAGKTCTLEAGEELRITGTRHGIRAYLCVKGGFHTPRILDSHSALEPLRAGAILACSSGRIRHHYLQEDLLARDDAKALRVIPGQQAEWFSHHNFYGPAFAVMPESDRMGLRLNGPPQQMPKQELLSEPVCPGTVQVTKNGQCIILGRDGQTIGGYPKIAQVISTDLDKLAQLRPRATIRFEQVTQRAAEQLFRERQRDLRNWLTRIRTAVAVDY